MARVKGPSAADVRKHLMEEQRRERLSAVETIWQEPDDDIEHDTEARKLAHALGVPRPAGHIYLARGLDTVEKVNAYCDLGPHMLHSPWTLPDIVPAVDRIEAAIRGGEKIHVHGDYDADGVTSVSVIVRTLRRLLGDKRENLTFHCPHRMREGYDVQIPTIESAHERGVTLFISVDCGIVAFEAARRARELGMDIIFTDHHEPDGDGTLPDALAVVNANRHDSTYPFPSLAGVGCAYKLMVALCERFGVSQEMANSQLLDLVAIGTVADVTPMYDENRAMVKMGIDMMNGEKVKKGIASILKACNIKVVTPTTIGFTIGPRINAVGRLHDPNQALDLMLETSEGRADDLAKALSKVNELRQRMQAEAFAQAQEMVGDITGRHSIVVWSPDWHPGIVGLVAANLAQTYGVPTLVLSVLDNGYAKGSARSAQGFNMIEALRSEAIVGLWKKKADGRPICGGHPFAAGFSLPVENLPLLRDRFDEAAARVKPARLFRADAEVMPSEINAVLARAIHRLAPFGNNNADNGEPLLLTRDLTVVEALPLGAEGKHLKLILTSPYQARGAENIEAVMWKAGHRVSEVQAGDRVDILYRLSEEEWRGKMQLQLLMEDFRHS